MDSKDDKIVEVRRDIIKCLIPTSAYSSLQPSAKSLVLDTADMLVNYIMNGKPIEKSAPVKDKRKRAPKN